MKLWHVFEIRNLLARNDQAVIRAIKRLYERQTNDEQQAADTKHLNGRGFNSADAKFGTKLAQQILAWENGENNYKQPLSKRQLDIARRMVRKYAGQLALIANNGVPAPDDHWRRSEEAVAA